MLAHPTLDLLHALGLHGMAKGYQEIAANPEARALDHAEWLGLLLEHEATLRQKRFETRARAARLRHAASIEDVDYRSHRGLDRALFLKLAACDWIRSRRNLLITGPCGVGKSWLACALGHKACRDDLSVLYYRVPRLFAAARSGLLTRASRSPEPRRSGRQNTPFSPPAFRAFRASLAPARETGSPPTRDAGSHEDKSPRRPLLQARRDMRLDFPREQSVHAPVPSASTSLGDRAPPVLGRTRGRGGDGTSRPHLPRDPR